MPRPAIRITLDGRDLTDRLRPVLSTLSLTESRDSEADELQMVLSDHDGRTPLPPKGAVVTLELGYEGKPLINKGSFKIDQRSLSGSPDIMTLRAKSADFTADLTARRDQSWRSTTLGQVLGELAGRQGLGSVVAPELAAIEVPLLDQSRESDAAFLRRLGKRYDAVATIKAGQLLFTPIGAAATASGTALPTFEIRRQDGDQHSWEEADRDRYDGVSARWHDTGSAQSHTVHEDIAGDASDSGGRRKRLRRTYATEADARAAARAESRRLARGAATFSYSLAVGRPELYPEQKGKLQGFGRSVIDDQTWVIAKATHDWTSDALTTKLELETA